MGFCLHCFTANPESHQEPANGLDFNTGVCGNLHDFHPVLNDVSFNASFPSNLNDWTNQLVEDARLKVADAFGYRPQRPSFLTVGQTPATEDVLLRGIRGLRADTVFMRLRLCHMNSGEEE